MTADITLRPFTEDDFDKLIEWVDSPSFLLQWAGPIFSYPLGESQLREHLEATNDPEPSRLAFKAVDSTEQMVGYVELNTIDRRNLSASVSRVIVSPDERGRGHGTSMLYRLLEIGFEELGLHRIELRVFDFNESAITCYEKVGFTREGTLREARRHEDEYWTLVQMSVLEDEWRTST
ncbi:GNAT family N-acetyltransferase [Halomontanus rarus]|uniref:GNAT family N-acetyltransferase n=1 Tax=Halomontanus rarus TaxID=3034020 RepID=UPI0023E80CC6|nr:GNAT family protein [Halovivax sp. TS33]